MDDFRVLVKKKNSTGLKSSLENNVTGKPVCCWRWWVCLRVWLQDPVPKCQSFPNALSHFGWTRQLLVVLRPRCFSCTNLEVMSTLCKMLAIVSALFTGGSHKFPGICRFLATHLDIAASLGSAATQVVVVVGWFQPANLGWNYKLLSLRRLKASSTILHMTWLNYIILLLTQKELQVLISVFCKLHKEH